MQPTIAMQSCRRRRNRPPGCLKVGDGDDDGDGDGDGDGGGGGGGEG